jgi:phospholipase/carboxylesterase
MQQLETLEIANGDNVNASIIWLHGLGADGHDFLPVAETLDLPDVRFIFPHAPQRPVTINGGYIMRAWYDLFGLEIDSRQDETGICASQAAIEALIASEQQRGIAPGRIILAGFSQGGAIALHTALRQPQRLGGVIALSSLLPLKQNLAPEMHAASHNVPIFMAHGNFDNVISIVVSRASADLLKLHGYKVSWHEYAMPHTLCAEEIVDIRGFLCNVLNLNKPS